MQHQIDAPAPPPAWKLWCGVLILAACETDWLVGSRIGVNWFLSALIAAAGLAICRARERRTPAFVVSLLTACLLAAAAPFTSDNADISLITTGVLLALAMAVVPESAINLVAIVPRALGVVIVATFNQLGSAARAVRLGNAIGVFRGVAFALPIVATLGWLLSQADPVLAAWRETLLNITSWLSIDIHLLFFCVFTLAFLGLFGSALQPVSATDMHSSQQQPSDPPLGDTEGLIVLGAVAVLFTLFLALQLSYLFGNPGGRIGSGMTYAGAVHRGFIELNCASSICGLAMLTLARHSRRGPLYGKIQILQGILTMQSIVLLGSAFYRVSLYEAAYGYTESRVQVQAYAIAAAIVLCLLLLEIRRQPSFNRLICESLVVIAAAFCILTFGNSQAWVATANLQRYRATGQLDTHYLGCTLGSDGIATVVDALPQLPAELAKRLSNCLGLRYGGSANGPETLPHDHWYELNLRRAELYRALATLQSRPEFRQPMLDEQSNCP